MFLFPSESETFGLVTLEALASGVPAVVADATGSRDIVRDGVDGAVCEPGNVTAFAAAAANLLQNAAARDRLGRAGVGRAAAFTWEDVLPRWRARLLATVTRRAGGS